MNINKIQEEIANGYIKAQKHPTADLYIYNYTKKAQYDRHWTPETMMCRGLILDGEHNIVARPFEKFFNYGEIEGQVIPGEKPLFFEKYDGSLGVLYWVDGVPAIATRGSFTSEQAVWATSWFRAKYSENDWGFNEDWTYLFEILYKENRIVVDYEEEELVLLGAIRKSDGEFDPGIFCIKNVKTAKQYTKLSLNMAKTMDNDNHEGFVVYYPKADLRMKIKFDEYVRLHRLVTGCTARSIWDIMRTGGSIDELVERVPEEFETWVNRTYYDLQVKYSEISYNAKLVYEVTKHWKRKKAANHIMNSHKKISKIIFHLLDGKPEEKRKELIWRMIRPDHETPFKQEE